MRKITAVFVLVLVGGFTASAGRKPEDVFNWISDHLGTASYTVTTPQATYPEKQSAKVEFEGCNVTLTEDVATQKGNILTTVSFSLSDVQTDMINYSPEKATANTRVTPYYVVQLPLANSAIDNTTFTTSEGSKRFISASRSASIVIQDRNTAIRQAHAWRDASLACGAR